MFHTHSLITDSDIKFVYEVYFSHEFGELKDHQQLNLIEKILNEGCFKSFIIKVVIFDNNAQKLNVTFLKMMILLLADLQSEPGFHN